MANSNAYMAEYMQARRIRRRAEAIAYLGGRCYKCKCITDDLEFDHIDPSTKLFTISSGLDKPWRTILNELDKCQLLCKPCHNRKTHGVEHGQGLTGKRGCYCSLCKPVKDNYMVQFRKTHPRFS